MALALAADPPYRPVMTNAALSRPGLGIAFILAAMTAISINDMLIKQLSGGYPLHQMVFCRSAIGIVFSLILVQFEGGWSILKTATPWLHGLRGLLIVFANLSYFTALAAVPLAEATALFFIAPILITLLSIPLLGERVGIYRIGAVVAGLLGVVLMLQPWRSAAERPIDMAILLLPIVGATFYALYQIMTRKLGAATKASALALYIQTAFLFVSLLFYLVAGDGRFVQNTDNPSLVFLLREWIWPAGTDLYLFLVLGLNSAVVAYTISQAYRLANAATIAPFEYVGLPLAIFWGWFMWNEWPGLFVWAGIALIVSSGLFVFVREHIRERRLASVQAVKRRY